MGRKGRKRREKNYRAAHGGDTRLPPPPNTSQVDVLPSKLRKIMLLRRNHNNSEVDLTKNNRKRIVPLPTNGEVDIKANSGHDEKRAKRKRIEVDDLRFSNDVCELTSASLSKRTRRKMFLEERKKKHKKCKNDHLEFPRQEEIKFGEVVEAPPKLTVPKVQKTHPSASRERLRLQAIEAFRNQRKWESRPGTHLPPISAAVSPGVLE